MKYQSVSPRVMLEAETVLATLGGIMHFPIHINVLGVVINTHLFFELLAYSLGFRYYLYLRKQQIDPVATDHRIWLLIAAAAGALLGSRLLGAFEHLSSATVFSQLATGKTIVGGLLGGLWAVELCKKGLGIEHSSGDLFCLPLILAIFIGRIGCFSQGVFDGTHGVQTTSIFGMDLGDGLLRHPTQLYEMAFLMCLFILLHRLIQKQILVAGGLFKIFMISYLLWRLLIDMLKPIDIIAPIGLSAIQIACVVGLLYYWKTITNPRMLMKNAY